jgi:ribose-phosphate pyrophosphokinase
MILVNNKLVKQETFGDKTLKCEIPDTLKKSTLDFNFFGAGTKSYHIVWCYDNDSELFLLQCIVDEIRDIEPTAIISLKMPYIPNARQDRKVSNRFFTLKTFCKLINNMNFESVTVLDPHSDVSTALLDRVNVEVPLKDCYRFAKDVVFMYPDAGASKKYKDDGNAIIGNKHRNEEGRIDRYELLNFKEGTKTVAIIDDIVSYGGTFVSAARALREKGVEHIVLIVSHCEENIFKGQVFEYIDHVYTTDSILDINNMSVNVDKETLNKITFTRKYREVQEDDTSKAR